MAMIECKECNNRISDSAPVCPQCGAPSPGGAHRLIFTRPSFVGAAVGIDVFVDGMPYGRLGVRKKIEIPVSPGSHHVEIINTREAPTSHPSPPPPETRPSESARGACDLQSTWSRWTRSASRLFATHPLSSTERFSPHQSPNGSVMDAWIPDCCF